MTGIIGRADAGPAGADLTPESLRTLLLGADRLVRVQDPARGAESEARAERSGAESWRVEIGGAAADGPIVTTAANTDATFDLIRSWLAGDDWWREAFRWQTGAEPAGG